VHARFFPYLHVFVAGCIVAPFSPALLRDAGLYFFVAGGPALALSLALAAPRLRRAPLLVAGFALGAFALYEVSVYGVLRAERQSELVSLATATAAIAGVSQTLFLAWFCVCLGRRERTWRALAGLPLGALASAALRGSGTEAGSGTVGFVLAWYAGVAVAIGALGLGPRVETPSEGRS
jgi:hypothetical protein